VIRTRRGMVVTIRSSSGNKGMIFPPHNEAKFVAAIRVRENPMACSCPSGWCYRREGCRRLLPPLVPDFAAEVMRKSRDARNQNLTSPAAEPGTAEIIPMPNTQSRAKRDDALTSLQRGIQGIEQREREAGAAPPAPEQLAWLYERRQVIVDQLKTDLPLRKRANLTLALDIINNVINRSFLRHGRG
jgi:hypothetical protein